MKRRINKLIRTYLFFTQQEQKGIRNLLYLLSFLLLASFIFKRFEPRPTLQLDYHYLATIEESIQNNDSERYPKFKPKINKPWVRTEKKRSFFTEQNNYNPKELVILDINTADSASWVALPGIGPTLASRIITFRKSLGGFFSVDQLAEVYGFKEDLLYDLNGRLQLNPASHQRIQLNQIDFKTLSAHPYFKFTLSKAIVNFRKQHGPFHQLEDLKQIKIVNDSIYQKIRPYISINSADSE
jgi:DNA uptake protein ComE-like DNA-binding protein